ncbi:TPA: polysaccharide pyruvyl transferase family protein [Serratia fonticola]
MLNNASDKRQVVLYGAFDRYNYGDNLMPMLLEMYFKRRFPDKCEGINFIFSSIMDSDLSRYDCKRTISMSKLLNVKEGTTLIVVGGEVLGSDIGTLFIHVQENLLFTNFLRLVRRFTPKLLSKFAKKRYEAVWDFPYIPNKSSFTHNVKVIYNTVGGIPHKSQVGIIGTADFISARDDRTYKALSSVSKRKLVPDSVLMMSKLIDIDFLADKVRNEVKDVLEGTVFVTVQACPYKVKFSAQELADELSSVVRDKNIKVVLLPIGYASGHDDVVFLEKVKRQSQEDLILLDNLTVWEIMYVIAISSGFYGTSLHGVITAMSFGIPHYCINSDIQKLVSFLETWSVAPFTKPITCAEIPDTLHNVTNESILALNNSVKHAQEIIFNSLDDMIELF